MPLCSPGIPGQADSRGNFSEYRARFASVEAGAGKRSGSSSSIFYSFDLGLTHYISFSAEAYTYRSGPELLANQLAFMQADLEAVDRKVTPWVVALVHKDWNMEGEAYAAFYPILDAGKVDLLFCGHIQCVARQLPHNAHSSPFNCSRHTPLSFPNPPPSPTFPHPQLLQCVFNASNPAAQAHTPPFPYPADPPPTHTHTLAPPCRPQPAL